VELNVYRLSKLLTISGLCVITFVVKRQYKWLHLLPEELEYIFKI